MKYQTAHEFWTAGAVTATVCFLTPRPLRLLAPVLFGYLVYRIGQDGFPWSQTQDSDAENCGGCWQETQEYFACGEHDDPIDESIQESFPASDPPSFSPGTAAPARP